MLAGSEETEQPIMNDTNSGPVRAAIVGAGAIGGLLAAALSRAGMTVSAFARGATLDALTVSYTHLTLPTK